MLKRKRYLSVRILDGGDKELILKRDGSEGDWYRIYKKAFPIADERETPQNFIKSLKKKKKPRKRTGYTIFSLELRNDKKEIVGGATVNRLTCDDFTVVVFEYSFIKKKYRGRGFGKLLKEVKIHFMKEQAGKKGSKLVGILAETENPKKMLPENIEKSNMALKTRRKILRKFGYNVIDFPYVQIPLAKGLDYVRHLDLLINPIGTKEREWKEYMPAKDLKRILDLYFRTIDDNFESDPEYKKMIKYLSKRKRIPLKPLY